MSDFKRQFIKNNNVYRIMRFKHIEVFQISDTLVNEDQELKNGHLGIYFDQKNEDRTNSNGEKYYVPYQRNSLNYFQENVERISEIFSETVVKYYQRFHKSFEAPQDLLQISTNDDLRHYVYLHHIYLHTAYFEEFSYYGLMAHCSWDDEGLGVVMYKDEIVNVGDYLEAKYSVMEIMKHSGIHDQYLKP